MQPVHQDQASYVKIQAQGDLKKNFRGRNPHEGRDISVSASARAYRPSPTLHE